MLAYIISVILMAGVTHASKCRSLLIALVLTILMYRTVSAQTNTRLTTSSIQSHILVKEWGLRDFVERQKKARVLQVIL